MGMLELARECGFVEEQAVKTPAQLRELCHEGGHVLVIVTQRGPIHPSDRIVLAIGIVIAALAVADSLVYAEAGAKSRGAIDEEVLPQGSRRWQK